VRSIKQSAAANVMLFVTDSADHISGKTGLTLTVTASKDGAAFASISPTVTERANGWYNVALTTSHTDTLGDLVIRATASGADPAERLLDVVAYDPADAADLGLSALTAGVMDTGTAQAGAASTITLKSATSITLDSNSVIMLTGGTGAGQTGRVSSYNGTTKVATMTTAWNTTPNSTTTYDVLWSPLDKTGYALAATGLDAITVTAPTGVATTFPQMVVQTWRRFFRKVTKSTSQIITYADNGTTVVTTQAISDAGGTETQGAAS
jgi:hypothetical protein